jgi:glycosyltransferase involved in cell wall biosynthesis
MKEKIRILHVVGRLNVGGAESRIMDLYRNIDREHIQFDFIQHMSQKGAYQDEVESLGGHVYSIPRFRIYNYFQYKESWKRFFREHREIDVVHGHMTSTASIYLPIAKKTIGAYTIAHARSAGVDKGFKGYVTKLLRKNLSKKCDSCFTCSRLAAQAVFGEKNIDSVKLVPNAIDVEKFAYNVIVRNNIRANYKIFENDFVIGHVGRFDTVKNHEYMLEILAECLKRKKTVKLMLVGDGILKSEIEHKVNDRGLGENVIFAGNQKNIFDYYQAFDFFILPSFYEGLPGTAIEAQTSGLHGILSDKITQEAVVTDLMKFMSIELPASKWADEILSTDIGTRKSMVDEVRNAGFDVKEQARKLGEFYLGLK